MFDYLKDVLFWIKDKKGIFRWVNTTLMLHIGRSSRDQIIGRTDFDLFEPYLANQYQMDDAQVLRGRPITSRVEMIVFNHTPRWIVTSKLPVRNASGRIVGNGGRGHDGGPGGIEDLDGIAPGAGDGVHQGALSRAGQHPRDGADLQPLARFVSSPVQGYVLCARRTPTCGSSACG